MNQISVSADDEAKAQDIVDLMRRRGWLEDYADDAYIANAIKPILARSRTELIENVESDKNWWKQRSFAESGNLRLIEKTRLDTYDEILALLKGEK